MKKKFLILGCLLSITLSSVSYAAPMHHNMKYNVHHKYQPHYKHKSNVNIHVHHNYGPHRIGYGYHNSNNGVVGGILAGAVVGGILGAIID